MNAFEIISAFLIFAAAVAGGWGPLAGTRINQTEKGFPNGESFTAGVFLALSLLIMLPSANQLFAEFLPNEHFPWSALIATMAFLLMLAIDHTAAHARARTQADSIPVTPSSTGSAPAVIPVVMTILIMIPSFLLGAALSLSDRETAVFILIAVLAHKSSAGFGIALSMTRSTLSRIQSIVLYAVFAIATPAGIVAGTEILQVFNPTILVPIKGFALALASGVFLYMATVHDLERAPLICHCRSLRRFAIMILGLILTAGVRAVLGYAHSG
ncbi:MAG: ZIP family metal transporter [Verrucomicrobiota bacterium]